MRYYEEIQEMSPTDTAQKGSTSSELQTTHKS